MSWLVGVFCLFRAQLFILGSAVEIDFRGQNFCLRWFMAVLCFLVLFRLCFCFMFRPFAPKHVFFESLHVRSPFFGFILSVLWFASMPFVFLFFQKGVVTSMPVLAVRPFFLAFFLGVPFQGEAARVFRVDSPSFFVFPFCCVCLRLHTFLDARVGDLTEVG